MTRFQTNLAELIVAARTTQSDLARDTGISRATINYWCQARIGTRQYLSDYSGSTLAALRIYFERELGYEPQIIYEVSDY